MAPGAISKPTPAGQRRERVQGWGRRGRLGDFRRGTSGETAVTLPSLGGLKHLTGDGSESTWLRHGKPVFSMQTSTPPPPPSNASNSQPRLGEESGGEVFLMLTAAGNWASEKQGKGTSLLPATGLTRGGGT